MTFSRHLFRIRDANGPPETGKAIGTTREATEQGKATRRSSTGLQSQQILLVTQFNDRFPEALGRNPTRRTDRVRPTLRFGSESISVQITHWLRKYRADCRS